MHLKQVASSFPLGSDGVGESSKEEGGRMVTEGKGDGERSGKGGRTDRAGEGSK